MAGFFQTLLRPDRDDDPLRAEFVRAANLLQIGEFQLLQLAYKAWFDRELGEAESHAVFRAYMLRGEVPPIRRHGGQQQLEVVAFALSPNELSGIVQLGDKYVILKCEGKTNPVDIKFQEVRQILYQDIYEKKLRMAMGEKFEAIRTKARIDNFLAGTSQSPDRVQPEEEEVKSRLDAAVRPASGTPVAPR